MFTICSGVSPLWLINSPRGDGNLYRHLRYRFHSKQLWLINSPRGDGNFLSCGGGNQGGKVALVNQFPARGRKLLTPSPTELKTKRTLVNQFPARGRKLCGTRLRPHVYESLVNQFPARGRKRNGFCRSSHFHHPPLVNQFPARGRKLCVYLECSLSLTLWLINSPRGDGN